MSDDTENLLERRYLAELDRIEQEIAALERERQTVQRLLIRVRRSALQAKDVTRKNSIDRILFERRVLDEILQQGGPISAGALLNRLSRDHLPIKETTFRSYLHRMKGRGLIKPSERRRGYWELGPEAEKPPSGSI